MIVVVASIKGAPGVTTTATALAESWPPGRRVLLVEADPFGGDLAAWFGVAPSDRSVVPPGRWTPRPRPSRRLGARHHLAHGSARSLRPGQRRPSGGERGGLAGGGREHSPRSKRDVIIDAGRLLPHFAGGIGPLLSVADVLLVLCPPTLAGIVHLKTALPSLIATSSSRRALVLPTAQKRIFVRRDRRNSEDQRRATHPPRPQRVQPHSARTPSGRRERRPRWPSGRGVRRPNSSPPPRPRSAARFHSPLRKRKMRYSPSTLMTCGQLRAPSSSQASQRQPAPLTTLTLNTTPRTSMTPNNRLAPTWAAR